MNKRIIAIIPARSGSKGLKDKNIKKIKGEPLIAYTIKAAKKSNIFDKIIVSTDSQLYANISEGYGAEVPFLREKSLAEDGSKIVDVIKNILNKLKKEYDYFMLLQPTSPLRNEKNIKEAFDLIKEKGGNSVVSVCEVDHSPLWMNTLEDNLNLNNFITIDNKNRQELKKYYRINGAIYISKIDHYLKSENFYGEKSYAYIMKKEESVDIDTLLDFKFAEFLLKNIEE